MIKRTLLKELKELFRDGRIRITIGIVDTTFWEQPSG